MAKAKPNKNAVPKYELERTTMEISALMHNPEKPLKLKPESCPTLVKLWEQSRLSESQLSGWSRLLDDIDQSKGKSGGLVMKWTERVDGGGFRPPTSVYVNTPYERLEMLFGEGVWQGKAYLHRHERAIISDLLREWLDVRRHKGKAGAYAEVYGGILGGYRQRDMARANGAAWIGGALKSLAQFYQVG